MHHNVETPPPGGRPPNIPQPETSVRKRTGRTFLFLITSLFAGVLTPARLPAAVFTVSNTNDTGVGSLRQALDSANVLPDTDTIVFNIPGVGAHTIRAATALPNIRTPVIIDGYSQAGATPNTLVQGNDAVLRIRLVGSGLADGAKGFAVNSAGCTIRGVAILGFDSDGIYLLGFADTIITGNFIGVDVDGVTEVPNRGYGIRSTAAGAVIGGSAPYQRNVISANAAGGISFQNSSGNVVQGNYIGTDASGTLPRGNRGPAIEAIRTTGSDNLIGGPEPGAGNLVASSSGPSGSGILFDGCFNNRVEGNWVGTDPTGTRDLGNALAGIYLTNAPGCSVGGTNTGAGNVVAFNGGPGVWVLWATNAVLGNAVYANGGLDIDIGAAGAQANDPGDVDSGANGLQNSPVLTSPVYVDGGNLLIEGKLNSRPDAIYRIELFSSRACASAGSGPGKHLLGVTTTATDSNGDASFALRLPQRDPADTVLTATATAPDGGTSEFSACANILPIVSGPAFITLQPLSAPVAAGGTVTLVVEANGTQPIQFQWRRNGIDLAGETNATLTLASLQAVEGGAYTVTVFNELGSDVSQTAWVQVALPGLAMTDAFTTTAANATQAGLGRATNRLATAEAAEPFHAGKPGGKSMWFSWKAPKSGVATLSTAGSDFDTLLAVYEGSTLNALIPIAADDDAGGFYNSAVRFNADANVVYRIAVDGFGAAEGNIVLQWALEPTSDLLPDIAIQPESQTVDENASVIFSVGVVGTGLTYQWLFNDQPIPNATGAAYPIAQVTPARVGAYRVEVRRDNRTVASLPARLQLNRTGLQSQSIRTRDKFLDAVFANNPLRLATPQAAAAETRSGEFASPASLSRGYSGWQVFDTSASSKEAGEPNHCGLPGGASEWFAYLAETEATFFLNTEGSTFDTVLAVYTGPGIDFASLLPVACDNNSGTNGLTSRLQFPVSPGMLYYIAIDGVGGATGLARLNYSLGFAAQLTHLGPDLAGAQRVRLNSPLPGTFSLEASSNLVSWFPLVITNSATAIWEFSDVTSTTVPRRFYRVTALP